MKVLVVYYSETGNTEKVARALYEAASRNHEVNLRKVNELEPSAFKNYDLVFIGSACHDTDLAAPVKKALEALPDSPKFKLAGFFTHATYCDEGGKTRHALFKEWAGKCVKSFQHISKKKQIDFKGYFNCQGAPSSPILNFIKGNIISPNEWEEYKKEVMKHPTTGDLQKAEEFAIEVISSI